MVKYIDMYPSEKLSDNEAPKERKKPKTTLKQLFGNLKMMKSKKKSKQ